MWVCFLGRKRKERAPCPTQGPNPAVEEVPMPWHAMECCGRLRKRGAMSGASGGIMLMPVSLACLIRAYLIY